MEQQASPTQLLGEIGRMVEQLKLPGLNAASLLESRRKDIEALAEANRVALDGVQGLARKQGEILERTLKELEALVREGKLGGTAAAGAAQLGDLVQKTLGQALGNMRELAEVALKSQTDAVRVVNERVQRNLDELRGSR